MKVVILKRAHLVVRLSDSGTIGQGLIPRWALITIVFLFSPCNAKLLHKGNMELYK